MQPDVELRLDDLVDDRKVGAVIQGAVLGVDTVSSEFMTQQVAEPPALRADRLVTRHLLRALVPRAWTGDEALDAARLLREAVDAIWEVHGEAMATALTERPESTWDTHFADDNDDHHSTDESPF